MNNKTRAKLRGGVEITMIRRALSQSGPQPDPSSPEPVPKRQHYPRRNANSYGEGQDGDAFVGDGNHGKFPVGPPHTLAETSDNVIAARYRAALPRLWD
jgi:hypothetical protein